MEYELVKRKVSELKADPNQPRKSFKQEDINLLAQTYQSQGIINPIEIDAENAIITGEMRWRAGKKAGLKEIDCKLLKNITDKERGERQIIENEHNSKLTPKEREDAINHLWEIGNYKDEEQLGSLLGISGKHIANIIRAKKTRDSLKERMPKSKLTSKLPSGTMIHMTSLSQNDQMKIIKKVEAEKTPNFEVRKLVTEVKKLPKEVKEEVLKPKAEITLEQAKEVAEFPKPEQRKAVIKQMKQTKQAEKKIIERNKKISKGKTPRSIKVENLDMKFLKIWTNIEKDIKIKMRKTFLRPYSEKTKREAITIVERIVIFLENEFKQDFLKFKEVKLIGTN